MINVSTNFVYPLRRYERQRKKWKLALVLEVMGHRQYNH